MSGLLGYSEGDSKMSRIRGFHAEIIKERFEEILEDEKGYDFLTN